VDRLDRPLVERLHLRPDARRWADRLDLPPMVEVNEDARGTAYT
jgi:hypothetical protein